MLDTLTVKGFVEELASNSPAPGGGSVAALAGSIASGLGQMVFNLTVGKKIYDELTEEEKQIVNDNLKVTDKIKYELLDLMNKDTEAFNTVMEAFKMPKDTEEQKKARSAKIQQGYKEAIAVPLTVAKTSYKIYDSILAAVKYGNKNSITDAAVGALMTQSAIEGAILNVRINLSSVKDEEYKKAIEMEIGNLKASGQQKQKEIMDIVNSYM